MTSDVNNSVPEVSVLPDTTESDDEPDLQAVIDREEEEEEPFYDKEDEANWDTVNLE